MLDRGALSTIVRDTTLTTLALAIALGWALFQVADGLATFLVALLAEYPERLSFEVPRFSGALVWEVGGRWIILGPLAEGIVELAFVLLVAIAVQRVAGRG